MDPVLSHKGIVQRHELFPDGVLRRRDTFFLPRNGTQEARGRHPTYLSFREGVEDLFHRTYSSAISFPSNRHVEMMNRMDVRIIELISFAGIRHGFERYKREP